MTSPNPKQTADRLREYIVSGELAAGDKLPNPEDLGAYLTERLGAPVVISRSSAKRAYEHLKDDGLVDSRRGQGTFVRYLTGEGKLRLLLVMQHDHRGYHLQIRDRHGADVRFVGLDPSSKVQLGSIPHDVAYLLGVPPLSPGVIRDRRIGWKRGHENAPNRDQPMMWSVSYLPEWLVAEVPAVREQNPGPGGIYARIEEKYGAAVRWYGEAETGIANDEAAERLLLSRPSALLRLFRMTMLPDGRIAEVLDQRVDGDKFRISYEIPRGESATYPPSIRPA